MENEIKKIGRLEDKLASHFKKSGVWRVKNCFEKIGRLEDKKVSYLNDNSLSSYPLNIIPSKCKSFAFTLAEVLITLGIIGVVAAMTIPTLINRHQVASWESGLKKSYTTITNGFHMIATENGGDLRNSGLFDDIDDDTFSERMDKAVKEHFKVVKTCKIGDTENCPGYDTTTPLAGTYGKNTSEFEYFKAENLYVIHFADGSIASIRNQKCTQNPYYNESNFKFNCAIVYIDINGMKKPNIRGKDIFQLGSLDEKGNIYPHTSMEWVKAKIGNDMAITYHNYWKNNVYQCGTPDIKIKQDVNSIEGQNCLARIIENGWQMDYLK